MKKIYFLLFSFLIISDLLAQITAIPELPVANQKVTVRFDSSKESRLGQYTGELYAHTGVIIEGISSWQHVIGSWGNNLVQPKLTHKGDGIYELEILPNINSFYSVSGSEKVIKIAFVFRSSDGKKQTNDLFLTVYEEGLVVEITQPAENSILSKNKPVLFSAKTSANAALKFYLDGYLVAQQTGKEITTNYTFLNSGYYLLVAEAVVGNVTKKDTLKLFVREETLTQTKPSQYKKGINYTGENSVALVLWAPKKEFVFVAGDFNNWQLQTSYQMKKDGDFFWIEINNLTKGKEYIFQYWIDGKIRIADPYSEKLSDPWNDKNISNTTYPGLISYPAGKTEGIASVIQTGQTRFSWEVPVFQIPDKNKLIIYELLVRDFTTDRTYKAVREKLDYLKDLNINVLELMPVNEFEGNSSWGYNPSYYFAPEKYYGPKNELKKLVDECHKRGIAVVIDLVLNHTYGQSPFVQMYVDNGVISPDNPWYNAKSNFQNSALQWGYDINHESLATRELVDSIASFWMSEYKVDGFRFDFTKGFSNTPYPASSWGSDYDAARVANLKRMSGEIWKRKKDAIVIFEHLSDNREEKELADAGILLWGIMTGSYKEAAKGNAAGSNLSNGVYDARGWTKPHLITYAESHDEERIMVDCISNGIKDGSYDIKQLPNALNRIELNGVFLIPLPGPKMIWQFGERGYDISINDFGGRLNEKPPRWEYLTDKDRLDLFKVISRLNYLKINHPAFSPDVFSYSLNGEIRWYKLSKANDHALAVGNFATQARSTEITFPATGKWYDVFTGDSILVESLQQNFALLPGGYKLFVNKKPTFPTVVTHSEEMGIQNSELKIYPNPVTDKLNIISGKSFSEVAVYSVTGIKIAEGNYSWVQSASLNLSGFLPGVYLVQIRTAEGMITRKINIGAN